MESSQGHKDLSSLLKNQENCNTETGYGILLFPSGGKFLLALKFLWLSRGALLCRHQLSSSSPLLFNTGTPHLACSRIQNSSLTLRPMSVSSMRPTLPTKISAHLGFSYHLVPSVLFQNQPMRG